ncbi:hypothetical protein Hanom_Chr03g00259031 [Helianthus anomalus]
MSIVAASFQSDEHIHFFNIKTKQIIFYILRNIYANHILFLSVRRYQHSTTNSHSLQQISSTNHQIPYPESIAHLHFNPMADKIYLSGSNPSRSLIHRSNGRQNPPSSHHRRRIRF